MGGGTYICIYILAMVSINNAFRKITKLQPNVRCDATNRRTLVDVILRCFEFNNCIVRLFFNLNKKIHEKARASIFIVWYSMHCCGKYLTDIF